MAYIGDSKRELKVEKQHTSTNMGTYTPTLHLKSMLLCTMQMFMPAFCTRILLSLSMQGAVTFWLLLNTSGHFNDGPDGCDCWVGKDIDTMDNVEAGVMEDGIEVGQPSENDWESEYN